MTVTSRMIASQAAALGGSESFSLASNIPNTGLAYKAGNPCKA